MLRDLAYGMRGEDVRALQEGLNEYFGRRRLEPDGRFGNQTRAAVEAFQKANRGTGRRDGSPDGIVGQRTRYKLFPLATYSVGLMGFRLTMPTLPGGGGLQPPRLGPGSLLPPGTPLPGPRLNPSPYPPQIDWSKLQANPNVSLNYEPYKFPGMRVPIWTRPLPVPPRLQLTPPAPIPGPPSNGPSLKVHHLELQPGTTVPIGKPGETTFSLSLQGVVMRGDDKGTHQEFAFGTQFGTPAADGSGGWSLAWYAQLTDVDRAGALGNFHWWQPYAQLGGNNTSRAFRPLVQGSVFPINLGFDVNKSVTVTAAGGVVFTLDPDNGRVTAGFQGTAGLILKFDEIVRDPKRR
jgi:peptidoglycan hydrolase-like protein with peptidoglycan-binding domain